MVNPVLLTANSVLISCILSVWYYFCDFLCSKCYNDTRRRNDVLGSSVRPSVNTYFACHKISVHSGVISNEIRHNIHHVSGVIKVRGQRSRSCVQTCDWYNGGGGMDYDGEVSRLICVVLCSHYVQRRTCTCLALCVVDVML